MRPSAFQSTQKRPAHGWPRGVGGGEESCGSSSTSESLPLPVNEGEACLAPTIQDNYFVIIGLCSTVVIVSLFTIGAVFFGATGAAAFSATPGDFSVVGLIMISTRRFFAWPSLVVLAATGR